MRESKMCGGQGEVERGEGWEGGGYTWKHAVHRDTEIGEQEDKKENTRRLRSKITKLLYIFSLKSSNLSTDSHPEILVFFLFKKT